MGPKPGTRTGSGRGSSQRGGGVSIAHDGLAGMMVEDLIMTGILSPIILLRLLLVNFL